MFNTTQGGRMVMKKSWLCLIALATLLMAGTALGAAFTVNDDGTITDPNTSVEWAVNGASPTVGSCKGGTLGFVEALAYIECLNNADYLGYSDWRLPTVDEFGALTGSLDAVEGVANSAYWTSSEYGQNPQEAYAFNLKGGDASLAHKGRNLAVWPVRTAGSVIEIQLPTKATDHAAKPPVATYAVTVQAGPNGSISPSSSAPVRSGSSKTFTIKPNKDFIIATIKVNGTAQDLSKFSDLTKPQKIVIKPITSDITIAATFSEAPKVKGFPTNLPTGTYQLDFKYCVNATVPGQTPIAQCGTDTETIPLDASQLSVFVTYFNTLYDNYYKSYINSYCKYKSGCSKFDGTNFACTLYASCKYAGYSGTVDLTYDFKLIP